MTVAIQDFRTAFLEFASTDTYPNATVQFWITQAYLNLNECYLGASMDLAVMLFVAHNVVMSAKNAAMTSAGGVAGDVAGPISSKSVGGVSKSYDVGVVSLAGAGPYNATTYGQRLYKMMQAYSAGPTYIPSPRMSPTQTPYGLGYFGPGFLGW